jgi:acetyl-CoA carboxylase biotin carboxyl carrier protein
MTGERDEAALAVDDARALIDALLASEYQELHVRGEGFEIFLARAGGGPNPMLAGVEEVPAQAAEPGLSITAPHVATIAWVAAEGTVLAAGDVLARLEVLGEESELLALQAGRVVRILARPGQLVEYGEPIAELDVQA